MSLLAKIIAKEWTKSLVGAIIVLFLLVSIGDIINGFLRDFSVQRIFIEYLLKLPDMTGKMLPISALLASLFSINKLKGQSELMAILAGGYSAQMIYRLIFICSLSVAALQFLNLGFVVPAANKIKREQFEKSRQSESKYLARSKIGDSGLIWYKTDNYFTSFKAYDRKNKKLKEVTVYFIKDESLTKIYTAKSATYQGDQKWKLNDILELQKLNGGEFPTSTLAKDFMIQLQEEPEDFGQFESDITTLNFFELKSFIKRLQSTDINSTEYEIMYMEKLSLVLICMIFSLFPISGVFTPNRRAAGFGKNVLLTLLFTIFFWGIHTSTISMGNNEKLPVLAATMAIPTIFSIVIIVGFFKNRQL
ncbi:MAG: hypothetical protein CME65_12065 [Halobacteriovoraceae bacterium]|nr:hypothetical protein [Halobacteriovoraceae bacterium]|tara:strand:- start:29238 stop:30326 length:1089 start_codon:yes stop_codon:yes gene_type:complete